MDEIVTIIADEACSMGILVSDKLETQRTERVSVLEAVWVRLGDKAFRYNLCELGVY